MQRNRAQKPGARGFCYSRAIGPAIFVLNLPDGQVPFLGEIQITEGFLSILLIKKGFGAS